jgi:hypothetical protein
MANILTFPDSVAEPPIRTSPSAEEAPLNRPRPHLVIPAVRPASTFTPDQEPSTIVGGIDLEIARRSKRTRLRRLFSPSDPDTWPLGAA